MIPLRAIVLMERSEENYVEELPFGKAYPYLLQQTQLPRDPEKVRKTLDLLAQMMGLVRVYKFYFNNYKDDCFQVAYDALVRGGRQERKV